ncbi:hypothetical protein PAXRUDRAFT_831747 [Paxillus rubicundulus Ve08.2h10]|uniref:Unplaced genomic scaffold scaffold_704, whole genome shotgun sequence n=1 Tax=Paxillus rubicundulus Ve08.2h10 TaxID=930991 RepID=A0A0D0DR18_9AGAM|nr:hypothetical protein PAXRUDRAFT_831747 [Paxillus rubicundulus Ve08.2h10]
MYHRRLEKLGETIMASAEQVESVLDVLELSGARPSGFFVSLITDQQFKNQAGENARTVPRE